ncbi:hypothetical protein WSK_0963 [Novosphingobium sp. Rr 2-17]|nr:hypothetical protein WSK_0963 [Novosphingobium sp. Rr 2-17]
MVIMVPTLTSSLARMQQFAVQHPEQSTVISGPGHYEVRIEGNHPELMPDMSGIAGAMIGVSAIAILLLAAAVSRRLHDTGRRGWWGLLPLPFLFAGFVFMPRLFAQVSDGASPDMGLFGLLFLNNMVYLGSLAVLVILLAQPEQRQANRFGPPAS